jgi:hypothetical protein
MKAPRVLVSRFALRARVRARRTAKLLVLVGLASLAIACRGKIIGSAELSGPGTTVARFAATGKPVQLWADTDMKWTGSKDSKPEVFYEIDVRQEGKTVGHVSCSTTDRAGTTVCGTHSNIMGKHDADCEIALACQLPPFGAGVIELQVTGRTGGNVLSVKKMSLNIRAN